MFLFSLSLRGRDTPVTPIISGVLTCTVNGYLQGRCLTNYVHYDLVWFYDPRFLLGVALFLLGMAINVHSDSVLRSLRAPGETGYKIPHGTEVTQSIFYNIPTFTLCVCVCVCV